MVVLDQCGVRQRQPVVAAATGAHRVLLQGPQAGGGLAGVAYDGPGALDGVGPAAGQRGDPGQVTQQVQRAALGGQQGTDLAAGRQDRLADLDPATVGGRGQLDVADDIQDSHRHPDPRHDASGTGHERCRTAQVRRHSRHAGDVDATRKVLRDGATGQVLDVGRVQTGCREGRPHIR